MVEIEVHKFKDMDLKGATVIEGFPSVGLVSTIVANYLIGTLKLDQIAALDSAEFPAISMVYAHKPKFPARIYADEKIKVAVFLSEFTPMPPLVRPLANTILTWAQKSKCKRIVTTEGLPISTPGEVSTGEPRVYGVGSTDSVRAEMEKANIEYLETGIISGVAGILLNEGRRINFDVVSLLAEVRPDLPDARAAAKIIEAIDKLLPQIRIDVKPLYKEAERIENYLKTLRTQAKPSEPIRAPQMYG